MRANISKRYFFHGFGPISTKLYDKHILVIEYIDYYVFGNLQ